jgi:uncharacterized protein (TIGR02145 family)
MFIDRVIGKYKVTRLVGEGGMASVYEAEHILLKNKVAIKILKPEFSSNSKIRERFKSEGVHTASLKHSGIIEVKDFEEQPDYLALILEYLEGEDLSQRIRKSGPLNDEEVKSVFGQVLDALEYAHERGVAHRDIKPSNIFILPDGKVKILDFGIAKLFGEGNEMTQTGTMMGTPIYMSPEQVKGDKSVDHRSDIYSLGVTLYFAVTGKSPYDADSESWFLIPGKIVTEPLPEISSKFWPMIQKACKKDRNERYQECKEWLIELQRLNNELTRSERSNISGGNTKTLKGRDETTEVVVKDYLDDANMHTNLEARLEEFWQKQKLTISPEELAQAGFIGALNKEFEIVCGKYRLHRVNLLGAFELSKANRFEEKTNKNVITKYLDITAIVLGSLILFGLLISTCSKTNSAEQIAKYLEDSINLAEAQIADSTRLAAIADSTYAATNAQRIADSTLVANVADSTRQADSVAAQQANRISTVTLPTNSDNTRNIAGGEVRIGRQIWMTTNLNVDRFRNGDPIPQARTPEEWKVAGERAQPAWCYYNNDPANGAKYGKLYNWYAVNDPRGLAPVGYHIPSDREWTVLTDLLEGENAAGGKMKSTSGWANNFNATNSSGFSGLPGGFRYNNGAFYGIGKYGYWWSSTEYSTNDAWYRNLGYGSGSVSRGDSDKGKGFSVRCLRD